MRQLLIALTLSTLSTLSGCLAGRLDSNLRPAVIPKLSELPTERTQRDGILDQSGQTAGPEQRRSLSKGQRKAETTAAYMAALVGMAFSKSENVTIGAAATVEENALFEKTPEKRPMRAKTSHTDPDGSEKADEKADEKTDEKTDDPTDGDRASDLVPWIKLKR